MNTSCLVVDLRNNISLRDKLTHAPIRTALLQPGVRTKLQWLFSPRKTPDLNDNSYIAHNMPSLRETQEELTAQVRLSKAVLIHMNHIRSMMDTVLANFQVDAFAESARDTPYLLIQQR